MGLSGGVFSRSDGVRTGSTLYQQQEAAAVPITDTLMDFEMNQVATALSTALYKDGQQTVTANLPLGGFQLTNLGAGTTRTAAINVGQVQDGTVVWGGTAGGTADLLTITLSPAITAYVSGMKFAFRAASTNTTAPGLNINAVGNKAIRTVHDAAVVVGGIVANSIYEVVYHASFNGGAGGFAIIGSQNSQIADYTADAKYPTARVLNTPGTETLLQTSSVLNTLITDLISGGVLY